MKIGIFGGTFNPVHNGHVKLAKLYLEQLKLDKLIVIPANIPPHKEVLCMANGEDRINMLNLAFDAFSNVTVSDIELKTEGKSYTINTVNALKEKYPNDELYLIVGGDMFLYFEKWKDYKKLLSLCKLCAAPRENGEYVKLKEYQKKIDPNLKNTIIFDSEVYVMSSSEIREKIINSDDLSDLVPKKVLQYIIQKGLYKND